MMNPLKIGSNLPSYWLTGLSFGHYCWQNWKNSRPKKLKRMPTKACPQESFSEKNEDNTIHVFTAFFAIFYHNFTLKRHFNDRFKQNWQSFLEKISQECIAIRQQIAFTKPIQIGDFAWDGSFSSSNPVQLTNALSHTILAVEKVKN